MVTEHAHIYTLMSSSEESQCEALATHGGNRVTVDHARNFRPELGTLCSLISSVRTWCCSAAALLRIKAPKKCRQF